MTVTLAKWTLNEYHQMVEAGILSDRQVELIQGEIVEMPSEGASHAVYSGLAADYLRQLLGNRVTIREGHPITLPNDSEPEPDIALVLPPLSRYLAHHPYPEDIFWLIEYADASLKKDLGAKKLAYAEAGIQEYWVVNLQMSQLIVFRHPNSHGYESETLLTTGTIAPIAFPEVAIAVPRLFSVP